MREKTLILIKPDAIDANNIGKIISLYEANGLKIVALKMMKMTEQLAAKHYYEHIGKPFYANLIAFVTSGPLVAAVLEGNDAIGKVRTLNGATDPAKADKGTLRQLYATDTTHNAVHSSDSQESAVREIHIFFAEAEIFDN
ncbi:nucleoside-diphosphate kinase [Pectinatus frisingensis]|uniref:nucleoside-diphosphate kinase n=1 Tax=Pectinatus frisingensis TaxID=865 RepID=UPI0018C7642D|nr:nucleoside-diphosphate kinase [Pectinatus frisingensis]